MSLACHAHRREESVASNKTSVVLSCFVLIVTLVFQLLYFGFQSNFQSAKRPAAHMTGLKQVNPSGGCWPNRLPNSSTSSSYLGPKRIKVAK